MNGPLLFAVVVSAVNLLLLGVLLSIWVRNYWMFRNREVLALCCFSVLLAGENVVAIAFHTGMGMLYADSTTALTVAAGLRLLQCIALCFLVWATTR